jgi:nitroimidazol reductase NimA-like FMN-containing flavoprotein (pyridoxamine 5'-phosphate oxidase superfamily)
MNEFHFRRPELMIDDQAELLEIIAGQQVMTLALCQDNQPYLVTLDFAYNSAENCFFFHSADHGKKVDYLRANPLVWGQVVEDRGYVVLKCDHAYRSVHFAGRVEFVEEADEKRRILALMIDRYEPDPAAVKARLLTDLKVAAITIGRIRVETLTGKQNALADAPGT